MIWVPHSIMSERIDHCATRHNEAPQKDRKVVQDAFK
jgi:hypothetical protein